jgi:hypothetical protein
MKQINLLSALVLLLATTVSYAQIGIGTTAPTMKLHISDAYSQILLLENTEALNIGTETAIYFKTGNSFYTYTGAIKTIGTGPALARLSLFTYAASSPGGLLERMSILDDGNVGIGISSPSEKLEVAGNVKVNGIISGVFPPIADNNAANKKYVDDEISALPTVITYNVGDFAKGGIVFWVDETGQHGLVSAKVDQSTGIKWRGGSTDYFTMARGDGPYAGKMNTSIIIAVYTAKDEFDNHAARVCNEVQITEGGKTYGDWYLPSREELNLMYLNRAIINTTATANSGDSFDGASYWSSTEWIQFAYARNFVDGTNIASYKNYTNRVRAVRAF